MNEITEQKIERICRQFKMETGEELPKEECRKRIVFFCMGRMGLLGVSLAASKLH